MDEPFMKRSASRLQWHQHVRRVFFRFFLNSGPFRDGCSTGPTPLPSSFVCVFFFFFNFRAAIATAAAAAAALDDRPMRPIWRRVRRDWISWRPKKKKKRKEKGRHHGIRAHTRVSRESGATGASRRVFRGPFTAFYGVRRFDWI